jgi:hypothetical protein
MKRKLKQNSDGKQFHQYHVWFVYLFVCSSVHLPIWYIFCPSISSSSNATYKSASSTRKYVLINVNVIPVVKWWVKVRGYCLFCWYWWNCLPHNNITTLICRCQNKNTSYSCAVLWVNYFTCKYTLMNISFFRYACSITYCYIQASIKCLSQKFWMFRKFTEMWKNNKDMAETILYSKRCLYLLL